MRNLRAQHPAALGEALGDAFPWPEFLADAVKGRDKVCAAAPGNARVAWEKITN